MVGHKIKTIRESLGMNLKELSEKTSVKRNYLVAIENDRLKPKINTLARIACALNVNLEDLYQKDKVGYSMEIYEEIICEKNFKGEWVNLVKKLNQTASQIIKNQIGLRSHYTIDRKISFDGSSITYIVYDDNNTKLGKIIFDII